MTQAELARVIYEISRGMKIIANAMADLADMMEEETHGRHPETEET